MRVLEQRLSAKGLIARGAFHPEPEDGVPGTPGTLFLVGNAGPSMWQAFEAVRGDYADSLSPLDDWLRDVLSVIAGEVGARALFPFGGPPYLPFQRWARKGEAVHPSPLGVLIHPEYGLWHAYRGALAFSERLDIAPREAYPSPCETCVDKPCLSACPVDAFSGDVYDVPSCTAYLATLDGVDCVTGGCRARRACPVGSGFVYASSQAEFHMRAFTRANG